MTRLFYIANIRFPTERAHGIQVAKMCEAFAGKHGTETERREHGTNAEPVGVTLLVPDRKTFPEDPFSYYGTLRNFVIEKIPVPDTVTSGTVGFLIESLVFAYRAAKRIKSFYSSFSKGGGRVGEAGGFKNPSTHQNAQSTTIPVLPLGKACSRRLGESETFIYTREELPLLFLPRRSAFHEAHQLRKSFVFRLLLRRAKGIISISQGLKDALVRTGIPAEKITVAHDGYDDKLFAQRISKSEARKRLKLPQDKKIALYIGGFESWKGAATLCKAATHLKQKDILTALIGGTEEEEARFRATYPAALFLGARPYRELPVNQQAADVLVVPNSARERISREFTSPLKLFAHMASGVPLIASRLPSLCEILSDANAYLTEPDNPIMLAETIGRVLQDSAGSAKRAKQAAMDVETYSWDKRAANVLAYMTSFPHHGV